MNTVTKLMLMALSVIASTTAQANTCSYTDAKGKTQSYTPGTQIFDANPSSPTYNQMIYCNSTSFVSFSAAAANPTKSNGPSVIAGSQLTKKYSSSFTTTPAATMSYTMSAYPTATSLQYEAGCEVTCAEFPTTCSVVANFLDASNNSIASVTLIGNNTNGAMTTVTHGGVIPIFANTATIKFQMSTSGGSGGACKGAESTASLNSALLSN